MGAWLTAAMLVGGCSNPTAATKPQTQAAGGLTIQLRTLPDPPHTGDNTVIVTLTDAATNTPVGDANLTATADMSAPRLPGPTSSGRAQGMGVYNLPVTLAVATRYNVKLHIVRIGKPATDVVFAVEAQQ